LNCLRQGLEQNIELEDDKICKARGEQKCEECKNIFIKIFNLKIIIYFSIIPPSYFGLKQLLN